MKTSDELLFTTLYGSHLYGTASASSDRDVKHVVLPQLGGVLIGKPLRNRVHKTNKTASRNVARDVDTEYIPIQVFARDFVDGQTYALELAFAIDGTHAEQRCVFRFRDFVFELRERWLTSNIRAMVGYCINQANLYSFKGERLNAARDCLSILDACTLPENVSLSNVYAHMQEQFDYVLLKNAVFFKLGQYDIGDGDMRPCFLLLDKTLPFTNSLGHSRGVVKRAVEKYGNRANEASVDNVDWKAMMHAVRIVSEGCALLSTKKLTFPLDSATVAHLLDIRQGRVDIDVVRNELDDKLRVLKKLEAETNLPTTTPEFTTQFEQWLQNWMYWFYDIERKRA